MGYCALTAFMDGDRFPASRILVTAVLPGGCPLNCPFCIVNQRDERRETSFVTTEHLTGLLQAIDARGLLGGAAIVGDEPLQRHCWPMAEAFLGYAIDRGLPTALISNGYNFIDFIQELRGLTNTKIIISLDAASEEHDEIRRKPGAFARIAKGLEAAAQYPDLLERMSIAAIMMPGNLQTLKDIIAFTATRNIPDLLLSPLLASSRASALTVHPKVMSEAWRSVPDLLRDAQKAGVRLRLSDEFAMLGPWEAKLASTGVEILAPKQPARLIRVDAAGRIETLSTMRDGRTTGLGLPFDANRIDDVADALIGECLEPVSAAA